MRRKAKWRKRKLHRDFILETFKDVLSEDTNTKRDREMNRLIVGALTDPNNIDDVYIYKSLLKQRIME